MTLQELQREALRLSTSERWHLVQTLLESLKQEPLSGSRKGNLIRLRGIAKRSTEAGTPDAGDDYISYLTQKYQ